MPTLITVSLPDDLHDKLDTLAKKNHRSKRGEVLIALEAHLYPVAYGFFGGTVTNNPPHTSSVSFTQDDAA